MEYGMNRSATRFERSRHVEIARTCLRQVGNQVCEQVCDLDSVMEFSQSRSQTSSRTSLRARSRAIVMEFAKFYYAIQLANCSSRAGSPAGLQPASELDSVWNVALRKTRRIDAETRDGRDHEQPRPSQFNYNAVSWDLESPAYTCMHEDLAC